MCVLRHPIDDVIREEDDVRVCVTFVARSLAYIASCDSFAHSVRESGRLSTGSEKAAADAHKSNQYHFVFVVSEHENGKDFASTQR